MYIGYFVVSALSISFCERMMFMRFHITMPMVTITSSPAPIHFSEWQHW